MRRFPLYFGLIMLACAPSGSLRGAVVFAGETDAKGATILLTGPAGGALTTGASGAYGFDEVPDGAYAVTAESPGTLERTITALVFIQDGAQATVPDLVFTPTGTLAGKVLLPGGQGAAGALVFVPGSRAIAVAGDDGAYVLDEVPTGKRTIIASSPGFREASAVGVTVRRGVETAVPELQLSVASPAPGGLRGIVRFEGGAAAKGVVISVAGPVSAAAVTSEEGAWFVNALPAGPYAVTFIAPSTVERSTTLVVDVGAAAVTVPEVTFTRVGTVSGTVKLGGARGSGVTVAIAGTSLVTISDAQGAFTLRDVPAGAREVIASFPGFVSAGQAVAVGPGAAVVAALELTNPPTAPGGISGSASYANDLETGGIVVTLGGPVTGIRVTSGTGAYVFDGLPDGTYGLSFVAPGAAQPLRAIAVTVNGSVVSAPTVTFEAVGTVTGKVLRDMLTTGLSGIGISVTGGTSTTITADDGSFTLVGVPSGTRQILATLAGYRATTASVVVATATSTSISTPLQLVPVVAPATGSTTGKVVLTGETKHGGVSVVVSGPSSAGTRTADDGTWSVGALAAGEYVVTATVPASVERLQSVKVTIGASSEVIPDFTFTPTGTITGRVTLAGASSNVAGVAIAATNSGVAGFTNAAGNYTLPGVPTGAQTLWIGRSGYQAVTSTQTIRFGQVTTAAAIDLPYGGFGDRTLAGLATVVGRAATAQQATTVGVEGTNLSATTSTTGAYTLVNVPDGVFTLTFRNGTNTFEETLPGVFLGPANKPWVLDGVAYPLPEVQLSRAKRLLADAGSETDAFDPVISPDAKFALYVGAASTVWLVNVTTNTGVPIGGPAVAKNGFGPRFSPDSTRVLFRTKDGRLRTATVVDGAAKDLATGVEVTPEVAPVITPDGVTVAYRMADGRLLSQPIIGGTVATLAAVTAGTDLFRSNLDTGTASRILFTVSGALSSIPAIGGTATALVAGVDVAAGLAFSGDGKRVLVRVAADGSLRSVDLSAATIVTSAAFGTGSAPGTARFTSDSARIAWISGGSLQFAATTAPTATPTVITTDVDMAALAQLSYLPNGDRILYRSTTALTLKVAQLAAGIAGNPFTVSPSPITALGAFRFAGSPATGTPRVLFMYDDAGGAATLGSRLADGTGTNTVLAIGVGSDFVGQGDGSRVAYRALTGSPTQTVRIVSTAGGTPIVLGAGPTALATMRSTPDGKNLAWRGDDGVVMSLKPTDTAPVLVIGRAFGTAAPVWIANDRFLVTRTGLAAPLRVQNGLYAAPLL